MTHETILAAREVKLQYKGLGRPALDGVSISVRPGGTVGIVGESGSGKSSLARCLLGLEKLSGGSVLYRGRDLAGFHARDMKVFRRSVQLVFQDPFNSLNPRQTIGAILNEVLAVHRVTDRSAASLLKQVGLDAGLADRYPHELSGGQRQRVGIARALSVGPEVLLADEPVSALDVSVQAHILKLLKRLVDETGVALILIAHDLAVVRNVCDEVAVMHEGHIVEQGTTEQVLGEPVHAYTRKLLQAVPRL